MAHNINDQGDYNTMLGANAEARMTSARIILSPLFQTFSPSTVLDVGCGHGAWLRVCKELGADEIQGVDGPWINQDSLVIPKSKFVAQELDKPLDLGRRYDLVLSLEVAEHLPESAADTIIDSLVRHGDVVLFSAAVPYQTGQGHINEQWQSYWALKFKDRGYSAIDSVRPAIWANNDVFWWLRQNIVFYMNDTAMKKHPGMCGQHVENLEMLSVVHPELFISWVSMTGDMALKKNRPADQ